MIRGLQGYYPLEVVDRMGEGDGWENSEEINAIHGSYMVKIMEGNGYK